MPGRGRGHPAKYSAEAGQLDAVLGVEAPILTGRIIGLNKFQYAEPSSFCRASRFLEENFDWLGLGPLWQEKWRDWEGWVV